MANPSKDRGTAFETLVVRYLRDNGFPHAERRALAGGKDLGDITGTPGLVWECKAHAVVTDGLIRDWWAETTVERKHANADIGILVVKRPRKNVADAHAWVQDEWGYISRYFLADIVAKLRDLGYGEATH